MTKLKSPIRAISLLISMVTFIIALLFFTNCLISESQLGKKVSSLLSFSSNEIHIAKRQQDAHSTVYDKYFHLDKQGFVRHWLYNGPLATPYEGPGGSEHQIRAEVIDQTIVNPPSNISINKAGPLDSKWKFYQPSKSIFFSHRNFTKLSCFQSVDCLTHAARLS